jgi:peroxiredoxin
MNVGDIVSDVRLQRPDGTFGSLADFAGRKVLLIFLRHLT